MKEIPMSSVDLIKQLDTDEPALRIAPGLDFEVILYRAGRLSIIEDLKIRLNYTNNQKEMIVLNTAKGK